jgi:ABC-type dipeptide/oligopeptide/nickel transport system permease subunit
MVVPDLPRPRHLVTAVGFNLLGDGLRDIFDPRLRGK